MKLVNIHLSVTQCNTDYLVQLLLSALFFFFFFLSVLLCKYFHVCVCYDLCSLSNVSITVSPSAFEFGCSSLCFEIFAGNQELFLLINKVFLFSPVTLVLQLSWCALCCTTGTCLASYPNKLSSQMFRGNSEFGFVTVI